MTTPLAYVVDVLALDLLVKHGSPSDQNLPEKTRIWFTVCMEPVSRRVMGFCFSKSAPNSGNIHTVLYEAFLASDEASAALPDEIWFDTDNEQLFANVQHLALTSHLALRSTPPSGKGVTERFFNQVQQVCGSEPFELPEGAIERFIAERIMTRLEERFDHFLSFYHHQAHPSTGECPLESWQRQARPSPVDSHLLFPLLHDGGQRRVLKDGIHYQGRAYWHAHLAFSVGQEVHIRVRPDQISPEKIEVFSDHHWLCSASLESGKERWSL